jgi:hypothetical protein
MTTAELTKYGLVPVARVHIAERKLEIFIIDQETVKLQRCIYAFLIGGKVVRIGSSKAPLEKRLRNYELHITHALKGEKSPTPADEKKLWGKLLPAGISGTIYARQGTEVTTPLGKFHAYMDEESLLIGKLFSDGDLPPDRILRNL